VPKADAPKVADLAAPDATHYEHARTALVELDLRHGAAPVAADGVLWTPNARGLWEQRTRERMAVEVGAMFLGHKRCTKGSDYRQIVDLMMAMADDPEFFSKAQIGVVCPSGFWMLDGDTLRHTELTVEHRQRFAIDVDPDFDGAPTMFWGYVARAFEGEHVDEQIDLAAELVGAGLFGLGARLQTVGLLLGPGASGKSTFLAIVQRLFPPLFVAAVSPTRWSHEYFAAGLAGKRLNVVGELPDDHPLPAAAFKNVVGGDLIEGRHPSHRPFYFRCEAAHIFNSNVLPATTDRSDAFFRRWRVLRFPNAVLPEDRDPDLAQKIIDRELGAVLAWAMRGAERAARRGRLTTTPEHDSVMRRWRIGSNPVLLFATDSDYCELAAEHRERSADVYAAYRRWAADHGNRPMSSQSFMQILDDTAAVLGITRGRDAERFVRGLRLVRPAGPLGL
jgi:putative DNA primase/helicase